MSSLCFEHAGMNNVISMVTASRNGNIYDGISSLERKSFNNNTKLSVVTRLRYDYRSDDMSSRVFADILFVTYLLRGAILRICVQRR